jgi:hypothetical protein
MIRIHRGGTATMAVLAALLAATPAASQARLDAQSFRAYGGIYLSDCANLSAPRLTISEGSLVFLEGDRRVVTSNAQVAPTPYGVQAAYRTALLGDLDEGQLRFVVYEDASGEYIRIEGDPAALDAIGQAGQELRFRRCDSAPTSSPAPAVTTVRPDTPAQRAAAVANMTPATGIAPGSVAPGSAAALLDDRRFRTAYQRALGPRTSVPWLSRLEGPSAPARTVTIDGVDYSVVSACRNDDCAGQNLLLLWSARKNALYGRIYQSGTATVIGTPPPAVALKLESLWRAQWRP